MFLRVIFCIFNMLICVSASHVLTLGDGSLWPKPVEENRKVHFYVYSGNIFGDQNFISEDCRLLGQAEQRFVDRLNKLHTYALPKADIQSHLNYGKLEALTIRWAKPCHAYPFYEMDEGYNLTVKHEIILESNSVFGIMRGLETLLQLFYLKENVLIINENTIVDYPYFLHRGLMIDTARHYIPVTTMMTMLDAMAVNKMNVLHWHLTDDESFPFVSKSFPGLSVNASFYKTKVYNSDSIKKVVDYAADRGIRVIPEISVPDHTKAIALTYPTLFVKCLNEYNVQTDWGPMHPLKNVTYNFLHNLYKDVVAAFPDTFVHIGYNDVREQCWLEDDEIKEFLRNLPKNLRHDALHVIFLDEMTKILNELTQVKSEKRQPKQIMWQGSILDHPTVSLDDIILQMTDDWTNDTNNFKTNFSFIYSVPWNLTGNFLNKFEAMYLGGNKLRDFEEAIGGEAYLFGHYTDEMNIISNVWPLTTAVSEVLWNPNAIDDVVIYNCNNGLNIPDETCVPTVEFGSVYKRLEEHICRMLHMGIPTGPGRKICDFPNTRHVHQNMKHKTKKT